MANDEASIRFAREIVDPIKTRFRAQCPEKNFSPVVETTAYLLALTARSTVIDPDASNFPEQAKQAILGVPEFERHQKQVETVFVSNNSSTMQFFADVCRQANMYNSGQNGA